MTDLCGRDRLVGSPQRLDAPFEALQQRARLADGAGEIAPLQRSDLALQLSEPRSVEAARDEVAQHLGAQRVVGALPALDHDGVAVQARQDGEVLDGAVAAQDLDAVASGPRRRQRGPVLVDHHRDAAGVPQGPGRPARVDPVAPVENAEGGGERRQRAQVHSRQDLLDRREVEDLMVEGASLASELPRLDESASHQAAGGQRVVHPRGVEDDADEVLEPLIQRADRLGQRAVELDLGGRQRTGSQLALQAAQPEAVGRTVDRARHQE